MKFMAVAVLAGPTLMSTAQRMASNTGHDFYNFWGVPAAHHADGSDIGDPYRNGDAYLTEVRAIAVAGADGRLQAVAREWNAPDYTGSPLLYAAFGLVPRDYSEALAICQVAQVIAFLATCLLLARLYGVDLFIGGCLALISLIGYEPLVADLRVANLGCLQFALLAALLVSARALRAREGGKHQVLLCSGVLSLLVAATLAKPNIALVAVLLALHVAVRHGRRVFLRSAGVAALVGVGLYAIPCLYFGTWAVWRDWYTFVYGADPLMLVRTIHDGNYSTVAMLSDALGVSASGTALFVMLALVASLVVAARFARADEPGEPRPEHAPTATRRLLARIGAEPEFALAVGVGLTIAASPLLWIHYYMVALVPCFWLMADRPAASKVAWFGAASIVLSSGVPGIVLRLAGSPVAVAAATALSWVPLWAGVLMLVARAPWSGAEETAPALAPAAAR